MNFSVEHIGVPSANPVALKNWYESVLGARLVWGNDQKPPTFIIALAGGAWLEIYPANAASNTSRGDNKLAGFRHIALRVDSIDATKAELTGHNVKFEEEIRPAAGGGRVLFFKDCEGNLLHLVERPKGFCSGDL
jgi:catechol 2,3-dioxygenase-like lactoylglutathione lyase family enzyme